MNLNPDQMMPLDSPYIGLTLLAGKIWQYGKEHYG